MNSYGIISRLPEYIFSKKCAYLFKLSQVTRHLAKLFDSIADLQFEEGQDVSTHRAIGMYSKEKEYIPFQAECECVGHVRFLRFSVLWEYFGDNF